MRRGIEFFNHCAGEIGLTAAEYLRQGLHPPGHFGMGAGKGRQLRLGFRMAPAAREKRESDDRQQERQGGGELKSRDRDGENVEQETIGHGAMKTGINEQK
jgi:hypothetical protein